MLKVSGDSHLVIFYGGLSPLQIELTMKLISGMSKTNAINYKALKMSFWMEGTLKTALKKLGIVKKLKLYKHFKMSYYMNPYVAQKNEESVVRIEKYFEKINIINSNLYEQ